MSGRVTINGTAYDVTDWQVEAPPVDYVRSLYASLPDPRWSAVDSHGHEHRWALTGRDEYHRDEALPTLVADSREVHCNGSCPEGGCGEAWTETFWRCRQCGEEIQPGRIPDVQAQTTGVPVQVGPPSGEVIVPADLSSITGVVEVTLTVGDRSWSGRGSIAETRWSSDTGPSSTITFDIREQS